ncbi:MAG: GlsB/YeaQ/YmgE family stress response membrane protein [Patescibacteria group bacterium]
MSELTISWVVAGCLAGLLTYLFSKKRLPGGLLTNVVIGIAGATAGGYVISNATGTDIARGAVTWGILLVSLLTGLVASVVAQSEARPRMVPEKE